MAAPFNRTSGCSVGMGEFSGGTAEGSVGAAKLSGGAAGSSSGTHGFTSGNAAKMATADLDISRANAEKHARALAKRIKAHPLYTAAYGNLLGIEGPEDATNLATSHPDLTGADHGGGQVEIGFNKSTSDGVNIYSKRDGDVDFIFLARDTAAPYVDNRPLKVAGKPEIREYKAVFVQNDAEIGTFSDELVVNCAP